MGLDTVFKNAAKTAFTVFNDVTVTCSYTSVGAKSMNVTTGVVSSSDTVYTGIKVIFTEYKKSEINDKHVKKATTKALVPFENLTLTPKKNDKITEAGGTIWGITDWKKDPADALWILWLEVIG